MKIRQRKSDIFSRDPRKEAAIKELGSVLEGAGYRVRREQLKQGYGWRVLSGSCRYEEQALIFVDRRLSQDDQISFLLGKIRSLGLAVQRELVPSLPERLLQQVSGALPSQA